MKVDFQKLKSLFDPEEWDIGILTEEYYEECMNSPIKAVSHPYGIDMTENPVSSYISAYGKDIKSFLRKEQAIIRQEQAEKQRKFLEQLKLEKISGLEIKHGNDNENVNRKCNMGITTLVELIH